jgi:hypothetical protein
LRRATNVLRSPSVETPRSVHMALSSSTDLRAVTSSFGACFLQHGRPSHSVVARLVQEKQKGCFERSTTSQSTMPNGADSKRQCAKFLIPTSMESTSMYDCSIARKIKLFFFSCDISLKKSRVRKRIYSLLRSSRLFIWITGRTSRACVLNGCKLRSSRGSSLSFASSLSCRLPLIPSPFHVALNCFNFLNSSSNFCFFRFLYVSFTSLKNLYLDLNVPFLDLHKRLLLRVYTIYHNKYYFSEIAFKSKKATPFSFFFLMIKFWKMGRRSCIKGTCSWTVRAIIL